jgi:uncharacterized protein YecE (DUF72 family)
MVYLRGYPMLSEETINLSAFQFRGLHPKVLLGTASDRYAGWIGQVYSGDRYAGRIARRSHRVGGESFIEEVLPVDCVAEYFDHFRVLEIDYSFYRVLLEKEGQPTQTYQVLKAYREHARETDRFILKAPKVIFAQKLRRPTGFIDNEAYLDPTIFTRQFYEPAIQILGSTLGGFVFEQEYQRKEDRTPVSEMAAALDGFFRSIPEDARYHIELRTETYLSDPVFEVLEKHGVGQVFSHWTWLPPLRKQFAKSGRRFFNAGGQAVIRLMTPRGTRYEDAYARAHPFAKLVPGMLSRAMVAETVELMREGIDQGAEVNVIINNRSGGNAPMIAQLIAERFLAGAPGEELG